MVPRAAAAALPANCSSHRCRRHLLPPGWPGPSQQLTLALVEAAQRRGVTPHWQSPVLGLKTQSGACTQLQLPEETLDVDVVIISAGLDSADLSQIGAAPLPMIPVLGQALELELEQPLGTEDFQPVAVFA
ncbi:MAG: FAD-dependent oxidoreductase [Cyanobacteria bacterium J06642_11]